MKQKGADETNDKREIKHLFFSAILSTVVIRRRKELKVHQRSRSLRGGAARQNK
jgi:hypothetical protein